MYYYSLFAPAGKGTSASQRAVLTYLAIFTEELLCSREQEWLRVVLTERSRPGRTAGVRALGENFCLFTNSLATNNHEKANIEKVHDRVSFSVQFLIQTKVSYQPKRYLRYETSCVKNTSPAFLNLKCITWMKKVSDDGQLLEFLLFLLG